MHELELTRKPELTTLGLDARAAFVSVGRSGETANCTPMRRPPRRQLQLSRPSVVRASLPFHVWPAYSYLSQVTLPGRSTQQNLTNFEAISLRLELLAVVNAKLLFGNIKNGRSALSLTAALRQKGPFENRLSFVPLGSWRIRKTRADYQPWHKTQSRYRRTFCAGDRISVPRVVASSAMPISASSRNLATKPDKKEDSEPKFIGHIQVARGSPIARMRSSPMPYRRDKRSCRHAAA
jgi:hypothetical protein